MTTVKPTRTAGSVSEVGVRSRLGIPVAAERVMVVTESTHWDPNWLVTSQEYFRLCVRRTLDRALDALVVEPRRVFDLECAFFPDMYWEQRPQRRDLFRTLVNEGRLRFTGSGVTTPDTLLPEDELLLRDLLVGQEWLRSRDMTQEPRVLYLPDSFGHSPGTPSLLAAAGVPYSAICRVDGMRFPGADMESAENFPRPGTSAAHLIEEGTADFVWRGPDGSEVLTHWMAHGYGHGDLIASSGLSRALGLPLAWSDRRADHVASRIEGYITQLSPLAKTPYLLLAIGLDFVHPIPRLVELLDGWNETAYERTGVWVVNAGLDDYFDLVANHRHLLPTLSLDPNPYWMGFYASRPGLKSACRDLGRKLVAADNEQVRFSVEASGTGTGTGTGTGAVDLTSREPEPNLAEAWWRAVTSNHHDYVTGTAPNRVSNGEQAAWLRAAVAQAEVASGPALPASDINAVGQAAAEGNPADDGPPHDAPDVARNHENGPGWSWARDGDLVTVCIGSRSAVFNARRGGALVSLIDDCGIEHLAMPSLELRSHTESGGLWRMGHEFKGGRWSLTDVSTNHLARIHVDLSRSGLARVVITASLDDRPAVMIVTLSAHSPAILVHTSIAAPNRRTVTLAVHQSGAIDSLAMHQPGGVVTRNLTRFYDPTFWPLHSFASTGTVTVATGTPTALHATEYGMVEVVVARTAVKEIAHGFVPVMAPAWGHSWGTQHGDLAVAWTTRHVIGDGGRAGDASDGEREDATRGDDIRGPDDSGSLGHVGLATAVKLGRELAHRVDLAVGRVAPDWILACDDPLVEVIAVKLAHRGEGIIVRLRSWAEAGTSRTVALCIGASAPAEIEAAWLTDSRERDLTQLTVSSGAAHLEIGQAFATVRAILTNPAPAA